MILKEHLQISRRAWKYLFSLAKSYTLLTVLNALLSSIIGYIPIYFSAKVIDALISKAPVETVVLYVMLTVGLVFLLKLLHTYSTSMQSVSENTLFRNEDWAYSQKATQMALSSIEDPEVVRLRHRIRLESRMAYNLYFYIFSMEKAVAQITKIIVSIAMTLSFYTLPSVPLSFKLAVIVGLILTLAVSVFSNKKVTTLRYGFGSENVDIETQIESFQEYMDSYGAGKDIRLYGMEKTIDEAYWKCNMSYYWGRLKLSYVSALYTLPVTVLNTLFKFCVYAVLIYAALAGGITVGSIAKYVACMVLLTEAVKELTTALQTAFSNHHYLKRYFSYFDIPNDMYQGSLTVEKRDDNEYFVEFRDVSFKYPNTETYALRHVNFKFKVGEKLAIVGMNGSGKTTFIKLLCRLYDPTEGQILLNGVDIRKYDYDEYMSIFSVVFQDFQLFSLKLGQIVAASNNFDEEKVRQCLEKANFGDRLAQMPEGVHTYLYKHFDKSGIEISGGEAQKIALARALYKDAPFIILDEPTAALDPVSEYEVYSNFNTIAGDKTAVYISHRLASCRFCDKIAVFDNGQIVQSGDHNSLLAQEGKYSELWNAQAQYYVRP